MTDRPPRTPRKKPAQEPTFASLEREAWSDPSVSRTYARWFQGITTGAVATLLDSVAVEPGDLLLDLAAGPGTVGREAMRRGARVTAADLSRPMLASIPEASASDRVQVDAGHLPFKTGAFRAVTSNFGLLHFPDPSLAIGEAARLLAPGGRTSWAVWGADATAFRIIPESMEALGLDPGLPPGPGFFLYADDGAFPTAFRAAGLEPEATRAVHWLAVLPSPEAFVSMFRDGSARTRAAMHATASRAPELRAEIERRLKPWTTEHGLAIPTSARVGVARKPID